MAEQAELTFEFNFRSRRFRDAQKGLEALAAELGRNVKLMPATLAKDLGKFLDEVRRALIRRHSTPFNNPANVPATGATNLLSRRGGIRNIVTFARGARQGDLNRVVGEVVVPFPLSVHELGTTITPKRSQFLTIPLSAALDGRGIPIRPSARDWPRTFVKQSKRGNLLIFQRNGATLVPLYLLKRSVQLPARLGAQATLNAGLDFFVDESIDRLARRLVQGT